MRRTAANGRFWVLVMILTALLPVIGATGGAQADRTATTESVAPYNLKVLLNYKCLDVPNASHDDGVLPQLWFCHVNPTQNHQLFTIEPTGDGVTYYIKAWHDGKCLDVRGGPGERDNGALVQQWTCTGGANQRWQLVTPDQWATMYIVARHSGKCLDARGDGLGARVQQWTCTGENNQRWYQQRLTD